MSKWEEHKAFITDLGHKFKVFKGVDEDVKQWVENELKVLNLCKTQEEYLGLVKNNDLELIPKIYQSVTDKMKEKHEEKNSGR